MVLLGNLLLASAAPEPVHYRQSRSDPGGGAAESSDWDPAEQFLAEKSAGALALLKRYHVENKGPYPAAYARQRYDE